jgi:hypothetical protein
VSRPHRPAAKPAAAAPAAAAPPPRIDLLDPRAPYLVPLLLLVGLRLWLAFHIPWPSEDALITFRYSWNWVHGLGPVFNAGERVLGYTSPPWMAWIALGLRLGLDPVGWTRGTLLLADIVTLVTMCSLLERHASRASAWCFAFFFAVYIYFGGLLCSGLESGAMLALIALSAWLQDRRHPAAGAALGLLAVFRPEGLLAALVLAVWARGRDRLVAAGILAGVAGLLYAYYGSPVPHSVLAKAAVYGAPGPWRAPQWWEWVLPLQTMPTTSEAKTFAGLYVLASPAAVAGIAALWPRRATALAGALAALSVVWLSLLVVGASYFFWYLAAPLLAWIGFACVGLPGLVRRPHLYVAAGIMISGHWIQGGKLYYGRARIEAERFGVVADYLATRGKPGDAVLLEPIGTVGWRCHELRLIDEVGLVSPEVSARRRQGSGWYSDLLAQQKPRWAVIRASVLRSRNAYAGVGDPFRGYDDELRALAPYEMAAATDSSADEATLVVLRRKDAAP